MQVGTQEIMGTTQWEVSIGGGMVTRAGHVKFTVQHFKVRIIAILNIPNIFNSI